MPASLAIHRLSARTPARAEPVAARLALQALGSDLEDALPRGLPPQALLWLRRMSLQAPEAALLRPAPLAWRRDWIAQGRERMDAALAQAARPALGPVPDSAVAVLFADAAEMLACLAWAAHAGQLDRWWWRGLLGRAWPQWQPAWSARPEAQAGAVRLLARLEAGRAVLRALGLPHDPAAAMRQTPGAQAVVAQAMAPEPAQQVPPLAPITRQATQFPEPEAAPALPEPSSPKPGATDGNPDALLLPAQGPAGRNRGLPPHVEMSRPSSAAIARMDEKAAPVPGQPSAIAVQQAPFAQAAVPGHGDEASVAPAGAPPVVAPRRVHARDRPSTPAPPATDHAMHAMRGEVAAPPVPTVNPSIAAPLAQPDMVPEAVQNAVEVDVPPQPSRHIPGATPARSPQPFLERVEKAIPTWPWPEALACHQAPLLFIVNALLEDGLYPDFTRPRDPGLPVPLWGLLLALADAWRLPAEDPLQQALAEHCPDWIAPEAMPAVPGVPAGPWPAWLAAYARSLRRRLCQRLGLRVAAWPQALMLARPARLWLSEAEWVAEFDLAAHDVAWRLAGLDRDPGWLPSVGCSLKFKFLT